MSKNQAQPNAALLDMSIDDIEDLPGFAVPPNGAYSLKLSTALKVINDKTCIESSFEVIEALELNDSEEADDPAAKAGTKFSQLAQVENDIAMGKFKAMILPVATHFGERNILKLVTDTLKDAVIVTATVKRRSGKKGTDSEDKIFADVSNIVIS